jgi:hypothetical protein
LANEIQIPNGINLDGSKIINLAPPTENNDAVTKQYVDENSGGSLIITEVVDTALASTTSSVYSLVGNCSITPNVAGSYYVSFVAEVQSSNNQNEIGFSIFVNGVEQVGSEKTLRPGTTKQTASLIKKVSWTEGAIEIRFRRAAGSTGNVSCLNRVFIIMR